jgi:Xaa-Pro aminopeptidase
MLRESGAKRVAVEAGHISVAEFDLLRSQVGDSIEWLKRVETVEALRAVKSEEELALIRRAAAITDQAIDLVPQLARPGVSERWLAWQLEKGVRELGADGVAFDIIVASGPNSALPHHHPGDRELRAGDAIVVDMGALVDGYRSDLTRTFYLGSEADDTFQRVFNLVQEAQTNALTYMRPGMTSQAVDALARDVISDADHDQHFGHGLGHGVGLDIHEQPWLSRSQADAFVVAGSVVTVEPGVYIPGWGGVRIEDLVLLTDQGALALSHAPKQPLIPLD